MNGLSGIEEVVDTGKRAALIAYQGLSHITPTFHPLRSLLSLRIHCITIVRNDSIKLLTLQKHNIDHYIETGRLILESFTAARFVTRRDQSLNHLLTLIRACSFISGEMFAATIPMAASRTARSSV